MHKIKGPISLKTVPNGVVNCRNLPFGERATRGSRVHLPRRKNAQSRHQRLFEENIRKTKSGSTNFKNKRFRSCFYTRERYQHPTHPSQGTTTFNQMCKIMTSILFYFIFLFYVFFSFWGRQKWDFRSYVSSIAMRNSDLHSSLGSKKIIRGVDFRLLNDSF